MAGSVAAFPEKWQLALHQATRCVDHLLQTKSLTIKIISVLSLWEFDLFWLSKLDPTRVFTKCSFKASLKKSNWIENVTWWRWRSNSLRASWIASHSLASDMIWRFSSATGGSWLKSIREPRDSSERFLPQPAQKSTETMFSFCFEVWFLMKIGSQLIYYFWSTKGHSNQMLKLIAENTWVLQLARNLVYQANEAQKGRQIGFSQRHGKCFEAVGRNGGICVRILLDLRVRYRHAIIHIFSNLWKHCRKVSSSWVHCSFRNHPHPVNRKYSMWGIYLQLFINVCDAWAHFAVFTNTEN